MTASSRISVIGPAVRASASSSAARWTLCVPITTSTCAARCRDELAVLLGEAAGHDDLAAVALVLPGLQVAEVAVQLVVGVLTDAARVEHDDVGVVLVVRPAPARRPRAGRRCARSRARSSGTRRCARRSGESRRTRLPARSCPGWRRPRRRERRARAVRAPGTEVEQPDVQDEEIEVVGPGGEQRRVIVDRLEHTDRGGHTGGHLRQRPLNSIRA